MSAWAARAEVGCGFRLRCVRHGAIVLLLLGVNAALVPPVASQPPPSPRCEQSFAVFVDVQGVVEYRTAMEPTWRAAVVGERLCAGDTVRVSPVGQARARLTDGTMIGLDRNTSSIFGAPAAAPAAEGTLIELLRGLIHVISRDPRSLRFNTPYVNAGLEGTEFTIVVDEQSTEVAVVEGTVALSNNRGSIALGSGARAIARSGAGPVVAGAASSAEILAWTGHVPRIFVTPGPPADAVPSLAQARSAAFYAGRAEARLRRGVIGLALADIEESLRLVPDNAAALALRSLAELAANDRAAARATIDLALAAEPDHVPSLLAASFVYQTQGDRDRARAIVDAATALEPNNHLALTRSAELLVADGNAAAALTVIDRALSLEPGSGRAHAVRGFAYLMQSRSDRALEAFSRAVALDTRLPLARVGLAIAHVHTGNLAAGREELETAVALDPRNAVLRSYAAKTYAAQNRTELSDTQLDLAREFDPLDPTPWLYGAIQRQQMNQSVQALWDIERADQGDPLPVRSSLDLDEDLGARGAGIGRVYRSLGFNRLAMQRGAALVRAAPADHAGHQLLADIYSAEPRHQMARVNEQYTAQLLRPINVSPVQPQAAEANLFLVDQLGPSDLASTDLGVPFTRNGLRMQASGIGATNDTEGIELAVAGVNDRVSFSAGYFEYATDGFRPNNDFAQDLASALVQFRADENTSWLFELRSSEIDRGYLALLFDRNNLSPFERVEETNDSMRIGLRHDANANTTWLALLSTFSGESGFVFSPFFRIDATTDGYAFDLQRISAAGRWEFVHGLRHFDSARMDINTLTDAPIPFPPFVYSSVDTIEFDQRHSLLYGYAMRHFGTNVNLTVGLETADLATDRTDVRRTMPRLGITWRLSTRTEIKASVGEHLQGPFVSKFTIEPTIAPTAVAGFNHHYFGGEGERSIQRAISLDHEFSDRLHAGAEAIRRDLDIPTTIFEPPTSAMRSINIDRQETMTRAYLYWTPTSQMGVAVEYLDDRFDNEGTPFNDAHALLDTQRLPVTLSLFHGPRMSTRLRSTFVTQSGLFTDVQLPDANVPANLLHYGRDTFWVTDFELGYRFPNRRGTLSFIVANVFDEEFSFQDADPENPRIMPERIASLRFTLAY